MAKSSINGIQMHYQQRGVGPDVVFVHGITSSLAQWYVTVLPGLTTDHRATVYDLRGHGLTDITERGYTTRAMASDLMALLDHLAIPRATVVGHSFGGAIALHAAALHPDRFTGIVLLDTGLACLRHLRNLRDWSGWATWGDRLAQFGITREGFLEIDQQQDVTEFLRQSLNVPLQVGFRKGLSAVTPRLTRLVNETRLGVEFRDVAGLDERALSRIETPVLALYGDASPYERMAAYLSKLLPNCRYELLAGAGHLFAIEEPGLILERIRGFLRDQETRRWDPSDARLGSVLQSGTLQSSSLQPSALQPGALQPGALQPSALQPGALPTGVMPTGPLPTGPMPSGILRTG